MLIPTKSHNVPFPIQSVYSSCKLATVSSLRLKKATFPAESSLTSHPDHIPEPFRNGSSGSGRMLCCRGDILSPRRRNHILSCRGHFPDCRDHFPDCRGHIPDRRGHILSCRGHILSCRGHFLSRRGRFAIRRVHVLSCRGHFLNRRDCVLNLTAHFLNRRAHLLNPEVTF